MISLNYAFEIQKKQIQIKFQSESSFKDLKKAIEIIKLKTSDIKSGENENCENYANFESYIPEIIEAPSINNIKSKILHNNAHLSSLYQDLKQKNKLTNENLFWLNFKDQISKQMSFIRYQESGYSSRIISNVVSYDSSGRIEYDFNFNLNKKRQILQEFPKTAAKYVSHMKEPQEFKRNDVNTITPFEADKLFWTEYSRSCKEENDKNNKAKLRRDFKNEVCFNEISRAKRARNLDLSSQVVPLYGVINPIGSDCGQGIFDKYLFPHLHQPLVDGINIHSELSLIRSNLVMNTILEISNEDEELKLLKKKKNLFKLKKNQN